MGRLDVLADTRSVHSIVSVSRDGVNVVFAEP